MITYCDERITKTKQTIAPPNRSITGYGSKLPTTWMVQLDNKPLWRRVYCICYSNSGSLYVRVAGNELYIRSDHSITDKQ